MFEYEVTDKFFEDITYSLIHSGSLNVRLELDKRQTMMIAKFSVIGNVSTDCDRCTAPMKLNIKGEFQLVYRFGLEESDDESLVVLHPDEYQINVKDPIYELITVSMPSRTIHPPGECDEDMWKLVQEYTINSGSDDEDEFDSDDEFDDDEDDDDPDDDPRWSLLKNLN